MISSTFKGAPIVIDFTYSFLDQKGGKFSRKVNGDIRLTTCTIYVDPGKGNPPFQVLVSEMVRQDTRKPDNRAQARKYALAKALGKLTEFSCLPKEIRASIWRDYFNAIGFKSAIFNVAPVVQPSFLDNSPAKSGLEAAHRVLKESGKPMSPIQIWQEISKRNLWKSKGLTPWATIGASIYREQAHRLGKKARFTQPAPGVFAAA